MIDPMVAGVGQCLFDSIAIAFVAGDPHGKNEGETGPVSPDFAQIPNVGVTGKTIAHRSVTDHQNGVGCDFIQRCIHRPVHSFRNDSVASGKQDTSQRGTGA